MKLIGEVSEFRGSYEKEYDLEDLTFKDLIRALDEKGLVEYVNVQEDADVGCGSFGGSYTLERYYEIRDLCAEDIVSVLFSLRGSRSLLGGGNYAKFYTENETEELWDLL